MLSASAEVCFALLTKCYASLCVVWKGGFQPVVENGSDSAAGFLFTALLASTRALNWMQAATRSQCRDRRNRMVRENLGRLNTRRPALFWTSFSIVQARSGKQLVESLSCLPSEEGSDPPDLVEEESAGVGCCYSVCWEQSVCRPESQTGSSTSALAPPLLSTVMDGSQWDLISPCANRFIGSAAALLSDLIHNASLILTHSTYFIPNHYLFPKPNQTFIIVLSHHKWIYFSAVTVVTVLDGKDKWCHPADRGVRSENPSMCRSKKMTWT